MGLHFKFKALSVLFIGDALTKSYSVYQFPRARCYMEDGQYLDQTLGNFFTDGVFVRIQISSFSQKKKKKKKKIILSP